MKYYVSKYTGKLFTEKFVKLIDDVYGPGSFEYDISIGNLVQVDPPSLADCITKGNEQLSTYRYREIYPGTSWEDARKAIKIFKRDMAKLYKK